MSRRLRVIGWGFLAGLFLSMYCGGRVVANPAVWAHPPPPGAPPTWVSALLVLLGPAAGPFAEPLAYVDYSPTRMAVFGGALLALIAAHPCWPRPATAWVSGPALAVWFFVGFAYTYYTV